MIEINAYLTRKNFTLNTHINLRNRVSAIFGPSGSGKSTLLSVIAGVVTPTKGRIVIDGHCVFDGQLRINVPLHQRRVGLVFQDSRLFPHLTVAHNLGYALNLVAKQNQQFSLNQIIDLLEIGHLLTQRPHQLSGGEKQRVAIGRALLSSPRLLMLDEPMASLDARLKSQILPFLKRVAEEVNIPMIYISHAMDEVLQITNNIVLIKDGKID